MTILAHASLDQIASELAKALVRVHSTNDAVRLSLPLIYPGGAMVSVEISRLRGDFLVSDGGAARREAAMLGGEKSFIRIATDIAQKFSVRFDRNMIFDLNVSEDMLLAAVVAVANAAKTAVENTAIHLAAIDHADYRAYILDRLEKIYSRPALITNSPRIRGASEEWEFDAIVKASDKFAIYDIVNPNANSVNSAVTKFLDIRDLGPTAPTRIAVVVDEVHTPRLPVLGRTARILRFDASDKDYLEAA